MRSTPVSRYRLWVGKAAHTASPSGWRWDVASGQKETPPALSARQRSRLLGESPAKIETYWNIGKRIVEEEQSGKERAEYGEEIINNLSIQLTHRYGRGFSKRYLAYFRRFYLIFQDITILQSRLQNLTWTHIIKVLRIDDETAMRPG